MTQFPMYYFLLKIKTSDNNLGITLFYLVLFLFYFVVLGIETKSLHLLDKCSSPGDMPPVAFRLHILCNVWLLSSLLFHCINLFPGLITNTQGWVLQYFIKRFVWLMILLTEGLKHHDISVLVRISQLCHNMGHLSCFKKGSHHV
jgi:hypothetical protein